MSHDTHGHSKDNQKSILSFKNSFWLVVIIVGLFVAALNFIKAESGSDEGEGKEKTEVKATTEPAGEKTEQKAEAPQPAATTTTDTAKAAK